jgi:hypothetical protein
LGECLGPVGFDGLDESVTQGFTLVFDGKLQRAVDKDRGMGAEPFVRSTSSKMFMNQSDASNAKGRWLTRDRRAR